MLKKEMLKFSLLDLEGVCETYFVYVEYTQMCKGYYDAQYKTN